MKKSAMLAGMSGPIQFQKLLDAERKVLAVVELDAELSAPEIAKRCKMKTPSVQRILQRFREEGVFAGRTAVVDTARIGLVEYGIGVTHGRVGADVLEAFFRFAARQRVISWVAEVGGGFDLSMNILAPRPQAVLDVLAQVEKNFPGLLQERTICVRTKRFRFWRGYLNGRVSKTPKFRLGEGAEILALSEDDRRVLAALSEVTFETYRDTARVLGMPIASFLRRIRSLKERKILLGFGYRMNLERLGVEQFRVLVFTESCGPETERALIAFAGECPWVKVLMPCLGPWTFELEIDVLSQSGARDVATGLRRALGSRVTKIQLLPIFSHRKFISFPPSG